jgi:hypothetical protein
MTMSDKFVCCDFCGTDFEEEYNEFPVCGFFCDDACHEEYHDQQEWEWEQELAEQYDTASLQDSNPEGWGAAHNVNPYGMDGGY